MCLMFEYRKHSFVVKQTLWTHHHERIVIFFIMVVALGVIIIIINIIIIICLYCCYNNTFQASILPLELHKSHNNQKYWKIDSVCRNWDRNIWSWSYILDIKLPNLVLKRQSEICIHWTLNEKLCDKKFSLKKTRDR